jgi:crossover junction endodeoxyribonuclease RusA
MKSRVSFDVLGRPYAKGSMRAMISATTKRPIVIPQNPKALKVWTNAVRVAARRACTKVLLGGVDITIEFYFLRPKSHYRTGRNADVLKTNAPEYPLPDLDKLCRSVLDAIKNLCIRDDRQVRMLFGIKEFGDCDRARITIKET